MVITINGIEFAYDDAPVFSGVSLDVVAGETLVIMGANGTGKTTLLKLLAGLYEPDKGSVRRDGIVGFSPEDPTAGLFADTVANEVAFFPRNRGLDANRRAVDAMRALEIYEFRDRNPFTLSVGEQRRVSIAAVLAGDPAVITLDEPTAGLDRHGERALADCLHGLNATLVVSTHESDFAYSIADRIAILGDTGIERIGDATSILTDESLLEAAGVRTPGIVAWARQRGLDHPPGTVDEAIGMLAGQR